VPTYDYICANCTKEYEYFHLKSDDKTPTCPHCGSQDAEKLPPKNTGFQLKGSGWAKDNYKGKGRK
jgi:putative FmdB family regulatory protein